LIRQQFKRLDSLTQVILSGAFVWIYARGVASKPWMAQRVRLGVTVALITIVLTYLSYFVVPMPAVLRAQQIILDAILLVILGTNVACLYRTLRHGPNSWPFEDARIGKCELGYRAEHRAATEEFV
jgi:hypothetical protein